MVKPETKNELSVNSEFEKHVNLSTQLSRWLLKPMGVWPRSQNISRRKKFGYFLLHSFCQTLISVIFIPFSLYVFLEVEVLYDKIKLFGPMIFFATSFSKYYLLIAHEEDIRKCIEYIKSDWRNMSYHVDKNIMVVNASFGRRLGMICTFFMYSGYWFYYVAMPISMSKVASRADNFTYIQLVFPFPRMIIDTRYSPTNEIVYSIQLVTGFLMHAITTAVCSLAAMLAAHACGQMEIISEWLQNLVDGREGMNPAVDRRIADIVNHHDRVLKFLEITERTIRQMSFVEFLGCTTSICLAEYDAIMEWKSNDMTNAATYFVLLLSFTFNIFIFCYIGQLVAEQLEKIGEVTYMIEWYRLTGKKKLCCILIIAMSNSSTKLTAGNMVELSINTFASVVKTSFAFMNVLRSTI